MNESSDSTQRVTISDLSLRLPAVYGANPKAFSRHLTNRLSSVELGQVKDGMLNQLRVRPVRAMPAESAGSLAARVGDAIEEAIYNASDRDGDV